MKSVLGIGGSPRRGGNTDVLLHHILKGAQRVGSSTEGIQLRELDFQPCLGCERCRSDVMCTGLEDDMQLVYQKLLDSTGLVLVLPAHHYNVTAWMKAFIDRLYCFYEFGMKRPGPWSSRLAGQGRKAVLAAVCEQMSREEGMGFTLDAMRMPLEALGYEVVRELPVFGVYERGDVACRLDELEQAERLGERLANEMDER